MLKNDKTDKQKTGYSSQSNSMAGPLLAWNDFFFTGTGFGHPGSWRNRGVLRPSDRAHIFSHFHGRVDLLAAPTRAGP